MIRARSFVAIGTAALLALALIGCSSNGKGGPKNSPEIAPELLTASDLPTGWTKAEVTDTEASIACLKEFATTPDDATAQARAAFRSGKGFPAVSENIYRFKNTTAATTYVTSVSQKIGSCGTFSYTQNKAKVTGQIATLQVARLGGDSQKSFTMTLTAPSAHLVFAVLLVRKGAEVIALSYGTTDTLDISQVTTIATAATTKLSTATTSGG